MLVSDSTDLPFGSGWGECAGLVTVGCGDRVGRVEGGGNGCDSVDGCDTEAGFGIAKVPMASSCHQVVDLARASMPGLRWLATAIAIESARPEVVWTNGHLLPQSPLIMECRQWLCGRSPNTQHSS